MKPRDEVVRRLAGDWLAKAGIDLKVCERLLGEEESLAEAVAFHAQQAAEKALKALLVMRQVEFPKTHDIERLLELASVGDELLAGTLADAGELTPYGVEYRYPGEYEPVSPETAAACVALARRVCDEVAQRMTGATQQ